MSDEKFAGLPERYQPTGGTPTSFSSHVYDDCSREDLIRKLRAAVNDVSKLQSEIEALKRVSIEGIVLQALMPYGEELTRGQQQMLADVIDREARNLLNGGSK